MPLHVDIVALSYGHDPSVYPALDENLMQSGTWLIDDVTYAATGDIELKMP